ncbi:MAG: SPOR domain-containing protein [Ideonella sp.]
MLRLLAVALLAANLLYFGWSLGWLDRVVGIRAVGDREPERLARQVRPELVELESAASAAHGSAESAGAAQPVAAASAASIAPASPASASPVSVAAVAKAAPAASEAAARSNGSNALCLEAGPFAAADLPAAEKMLQAAAPEGVWTRRRIDGNGEWLVYMGPYPDGAWLERKKGELSRIRGGLPYEVLNAPAALARGISLGRFASQATAEQRLEQLRQRGIRTARIVKSGNGPDTTMLRVGKADSAAAARLEKLKWPSGKAGVTPCPKTP